MPVPQPAADVHAADVQVTTRVAVDDGPEVRVDGVAVCVLLHDVRNQVNILIERIHHVGVQRGLPLQLLLELGADDRLPLLLLGVEMQEHLVTPDEELVALSLNSHPADLTRLHPLDRRIGEREHGRSVVTVTFWVLGHQEFQASKPVF